jgi:branched-chain amino acid transport system permease protein
MDYFLNLSISGLLTGGLYALVALSIVLIYKATEVVSLAQGQLLAFGALFFWVAYTGFGLPVWLSFLIALALGALLGFLVERLCLRPLIGQPLFSSFLMTFALFMFMDGIFQLVLSGQARGYRDFLPTGSWEMAQVNISIGDLVSFIICLIVFGIMLLIFQYTKMGLGMRATAESHELAQSVGIRVRRIFSLVWVISAVLCVVGGITVARVMNIHYPLPWIVNKGLVVALVGGLDSIPGALLGGLILGLVENLAAGYLDPLVGGGVREVAAYVMLLIILLIKPYGLSGQVRIERV